MSGNYKSVFDIIGPVMVGPSSSHTAGAVAIGQVAHKLFSQKITQVTIDYYESFAKTHRGHGTDFAIIAGVLGMKTDDLRVPDAVRIAKMRGINVKFIEHEGKSPINHPNTAIVTLANKDKEVKVAGCSIGGGTIEIRKIQIDGHEFFPAGPLPIIICLAKDGKQNSILESLACGEDFIVKKAERSISSGCCLLEFDLDKKPDEQILEHIASMSKELICL
ncbi:serine dehydratase beta chain [Ligilactobacillus ruminis]|uniref:serine dehydratase beta chain n=1 Tax=Ligilactobacillus ruminis TaxID=1623 RepID=UPI003F9DE958